MNNEPRYRPPLGLLIDDRVTTPRGDGGTVRFVGWLTGEAVVATDAGGCWHGPACQLTPRPDQRPRA